MSIEMPCIYFSDGKCKKFSEPGYISYCAYAPCGYEKPSNADRIRAMSDEELARFMWNCAQPCCPPINCAFKKCDAEKCWLSWLNEKCGFEP